MYTVQNKVLPGAYINFVSAARASATLGDRGTAAFPLSLDWGPENEVVTIENSEFQKGSLALTGYAYTADELRPLREIFANAKTLHLFRLNSGGAKAACKYAEAKYPGKIGNELKIVIQQNEGFTVSTNEVYDVSTYIGTTLVDTQKAVKAVSDLSDNDYLHWKDRERGPAAHRRHDRRGAGCSLPDVPRQDRAVQLQRGRLRHEEQHGQGSVRQLDAPPA